MSKTKLRKPKPSSGSPKNGLRKSKIGCNSKILHLPTHFFRFFLAQSKVQLYLCGVLLNYYTELNFIILLQINEIDFSYGRRKAPVFEHFSLRFEPGHIYGLLGKNGTGKSTLLYLMSGLLRQQRGTVLFEGTDVRLRRPEVLQEMFLVPEEIELPHLSMERYVQLNACFYPHFDYEVLMRCMTDFDLDPKAKLDSMSMGQRKKAFVCFALATGTRLLLMDEPTNGLDIPSKSIFRQVVARHITEDRTLIVSTHQVNDVAMLLDHVVMLQGSHLLLNRSVADISAAVRCEERALGEPTDDALYVQNSLQGHAVVVENDAPDDETPLDLELLFCCAEAGKLPQSLTC